MAVTRIKVKASKTFIEKMKEHMKQKKERFVKLFEKIKTLNP